MARRARVLAACLALLATLAALAYDRNPLTRAAQDHAETVAAISAATYVSLRAVNAFLSAAQEVEVGGSLESFRQAPHPPPVLPARLLD